MEIKELRKGNYLQGKDSFVEVTEILSSGIVSIKGNTSKFYVEGENPCLTPIPLTEEVLLRCGFEAHKSNHFWFRKDALCVSITGVVELIYWNKMPFKLDIEIKHLHQLQNFYYSICSEELTYNHSQSI